ncbi:MAG TPA: hypothetical protein VH815_07230 [Acidobacteriota bacterium]|jgi:hypothetical protein
MFRSTLCTVTVLLFLVLSTFAADQNKLKLRTSAGITDAERDVIRQEVVNKTLQNELQGSRYRIFGIQSTPVKTSEGVRRYVYTLLYDYSHNKTYNVVYDATNRVPGKYIETLTPTVQPPPSREEYEEAKALVNKLERVQSLLKQPNVILQESFPTDSPAPCDISRCVEIQVNEVIPLKKQNFLLLVTVDLSTSKVVDVRQPKTPTTIR